MVHTSTANVSNPTKPYSSTSSTIARFNLSIFAFRGPVSRLDRR